MSWWTKFRDWGITGKGELQALHLMPSQADRRKQNEETAAQIDLYKQQKAELEAESSRLKEEKETNQKKTNEKQVKNLRRSYRSPGFMEAQTMDTQEKLG